MHVRDLRIQSVELDHEMRLILPVGVIGVIVGQSVEGFCNWSGFGWQGGKFSDAGPAGG